MLFATFLSWNEILISTSSSHLWNCRSHCVVAFYVQNDLFVHFCFDSKSAAVCQYSPQFALQSKCVQFAEFTVIDLDKDLVYVVCWWHCSRRHHNWRHHQSSGLSSDEQNQCSHNQSKKSLMDWHVFAVAHSTILSLHCVRKGVHIHIYTMFMAALKTNSVCLRRVFMCGMVGHVEAVIT